MANSIRERRLRERSQVLREHRAEIDRLARQASADIENKYKEMYGENWREALSYENASNIEKRMYAEKLQASTMIEEHMLVLKSFGSSFGR